MPKPDYSQAGSRRDPPRVAPALSFSTTIGALLGAANVAEAQAALDLVPSTDVVAVADVIGIAQGGTGQVTQSAAANAILPAAVTDGTIQMYLSGAWTVLVPGSVGQKLTISAGGIPEWA